jgi:hypothetical protein
VNNKNIPHLLSVAPATPKHALNITNAAAA